MAKPNDIDYVGSGDFCIVDNCPKVILRCFREYKAV